MNLKRKIMAALVGATFLVPITAQPSEAASVTVYGEKCYMSTTRNKPTPQVNASVARFKRTASPTIDHVYIDIQERHDIPLQSVRINGRPAKFRWINHPGGSRINMDTNDPNLVQRKMTNVPITVVWKDNRTLWGGGKLLTCYFRVTN